MSTSCFRKPDADGASSSGIYPKGGSFHCRPFCLPPCEDRPHLHPANPCGERHGIHGELLKLGIEIGQTSVAKYMARRRGPPSQGWQTFLHNHADGIAAMDSIRRADNLVSPALRPPDCGTRSTADFVVWRHSAPDLRMDRKSEHGSLRLGTSSPISDPRSGWGLWRDLHPKTSINRHSRPADGAALPMAKRIR